MNRFLMIGIVATAALLALGGPNRLGAEPAATQPAEARVDSAAEAEFAGLLTGATMVGKYTVEGSDAAPSDDHYRIIKAVKADGDNWAITTRIEYKGYRVPLTLTVPVKWAGDTPVIEVTDLKIPALGTFTARVLFYKDHYVGTWSGGAGHGGTMWGRIEHGDPATQPATKPSR